MQRASGMISHGYVVDEQYEPAKAYFYDEQGVLKLRIIWLDGGVVTYRSQQLTSEHAAHLVREQIAKGWRLTVANICDSADSTVEQGKVTFRDDLSRSFWWRFEQRMKAQPAPLQLVGKATP